MQPVSKPMDKKGSRSFHEFKVFFLETEKGSQESKEFGREETPSQNLFEYFS